MREEIIITTEKVKLSEMSDRERKIYDTGYADGVKSEENENDKRIIKAIVFVALLSAMIILMFFLLEINQQP